MGLIPEAGVVVDKIGNLYDATLYSGTQGSGTPFELTPKLGGEARESSAFLQ